VKELIIKTNPLQPDKPLYARFRIKTYGDTTVTATVDHPTIRVRVLPVNNWQKNKFEAFEEQSEVILEVPANYARLTIPQNFTLKLQSATRVTDMTLISVVVKNNSS
jgi:hypothetical protein